MKILTEFFVPLASTLIIGNVLDINSALAVTFQDTTQGILSFRDHTGTQIGNGSFEYSQEPIQGTFLFGTGSAVGGMGGYFITDPSQINIPRDFLPGTSISISASQDLRLVTSTSINLSGAKFSSSNTNLTPGPLPFGDVFLFQPTENTLFPPAPGGPFIVSTGGARNPGLSFQNRWLLGEKLAAPREQLVISSDGSFNGFSANAFPTENFSGKWEAEAKAVPEPDTILGVATAFGLGAYFKRKRAKKQKFQDSDAFCSAPFREVNQIREGANFWGQAASETESRELAEAGSKEGLT